MKITTEEWRFEREKKKMPQHCSLKEEGTR
jgi:hypothetical protein